MLTLPRKDVITTGDYVLVFLCLVFLWLALWGVARLMMEGSFWDELFNPPKRAKRQSRSFGPGVAEYRSVEDFRRAGGRVSSVTILPQRPGIVRIATLGIFAAVIKPKPHVIATYKEPDPPRGP
jgi:hypothetical protein